MEGEGCVQEEREADQGEGAVVCERILAQRSDRGTGLRAPSSPLAELPLQ